MNEFDDTKPLVAPTTLSELEQWAVGDRLVIGATGGVIFHTFAGIEPIAHLGPIASVQGSWRVHLQKINENELAVSVTKSKLTSYGIELDGTFVSSSLEKFKENENTLAMKLDLSAVSGEVALNRIYRGDFRYAQQLIANKIIGAKGVRQSKGLTQGKSRSLSFNFPFLFGANSGKAHVDTWSDETNLETDDPATIVMSVISKEKSTRGIISNHKKELSNFYATYINEKHGDHWDTVLAGSYKWLYEKDDVKADTLKSKLKKLAHQTGIYQLENVSFPEKNLGYFRAEFDISLSRLDVLRSMRTENSRGIYVAAQERSLALVEQTILQKDHKEFCPLLEKASECVSKFRREVIQAFRELSQLGLDMGIAYRSKDWKGLTLSLATWGGLFTSNQFIMQALLPDLGGAQSKLKVIGEKVAAKSMLLSL
jgi:hypothetical protein